MKDYNNLNYIRDILRGGSLPICEFNEDQEINLISVSYEYEKFTDQYTIVFHIEQREYRLYHDRESKIDECEPIQQDLIFKSKDRVKACEQLDLIVQAADLSGLYLNAW